MTSLDQSELMETVLFLLRNIRRIIKKNLLVLYNHGYRFWLGFYKKRIFLMESVIL